MQELESEKERMLKERRTSIVWKGKDCSLAEIEARLKQLLEDAAFWSSVADRMHDVVAAARHDYDAALAAAHRTWSNAEDWRSRSVDTDEEEVLDDSLGETAGDPDFRGWDQLHGTRKRAETAATGWNTNSRTALVAGLQVAEVPNLSVWVTYFRVPRGFRRPQGTGEEAPGEPKN